MESVRCWSWISISTAPLILGVAVAARADEKASNDEAPKVVSFEVKADRVTVKIAKTPVAVYVHTDAEISRPYLAHVRAPGGVQVTRNHPPGPNDAKDHATYHPGIALAFGDINANDYWRLQAKVVHDGYIGEPKGGRGKGFFTTQHRYLSRDGKETVCLETLRLTFHVRPAGYLIDWQSEFTPAGKPFYFGDQEEMGLGVRVATPMAVDAKQGGRILDARGRKNGEGVWGKAALWCDYSGPVGGRFAGITVMPDPKNFRPCWWHARDYGLLGANPFGRRALTGGEVSKVVVKRGEKLRLRFGLMLHAHARESDYDAAAAYRDWLQLVKPRGAKE